MDYYLKRAHRKHEIEVPEVSQYVSDVYQFLMYLITSYSFGIYLPMIYSVEEYVGFHFLLITCLISSIVTILGIQSRLFGCISATLFGLMGSSYITYMLSIDPEIVLISGIGTFLLFFTAMICAKLFPLRNLVALGGLIFTSVEIFSIIMLVNRFTDLEFWIKMRILSSLLTMTFYVYYDTLRMFDRARNHVMIKNQYSRDTMIVIDSIAIFLDLISIFMDLVRLIEIEKKSKKV